MIDYGKVHTIDSVHEGKVMATHIEYEQSIFSTKQAFIREIIECMKVITDGTTNKLILEIKSDDTDRIRIKKTWLN